MTDKPGKTGTSARDRAQQPVQSPAELAAHMPTVVAGDDIALVYNEETTDLLSKVPSADLIEDRVYSTVAAVLALLQELDESYRSPE